MPVIKYFGFWRVFGLMFFPSVALVVLAWVLLSYLKINVISAFAFLMILTFIGWFSTGHFSERLFGRKS
jgi:hypothetical protein